MLFKIGLQPASLLQRRLTQVFSCDFYKQFNSYFEEQIRVTASKMSGMNASVAEHKHFCWHWAFPSLNTVRPIAEALVPIFLQSRCSYKFCKFDSTTPVLEYLLNIVAGLRACNFIKKRHRCFSVNFTKYLRTPFLTEYLRWLLLPMKEAMFKINFKDTRTMCEICSK